MAATVLLPDPMPPVSPMVVGRTRRVGQIHVGRILRVRVRSIAFAGRAVAALALGGIQLLAAGQCRRIRGQGVLLLDGRGGNGPPRGGLRRQLGRGGNRAGQRAKSKGE